MNTPFSFANPSRTHSPSRKQNSIIFFAVLALVAAAVLLAVPQAKEETIGGLREPSSEKKQAEPDVPPAKAPPAPVRPDSKDGTAKKKSEWRPLFDGKTLKNWNVTKFGGQGDVYVKEGAVILELGVDLTGITWDGKPLPRNNYEVKLDAKRVEGSDFFCGLTFPVKDDPCSLIIGGWGGGVCGLSSLNGLDASENETTTYRRFEKGQWYKIGLRVTDKRIEAWIDDEQIVDQDITNRKISIRPEVELSKPFGLASWCTTAALRNLRIRKVAPDEKSKPAKK